MPTVTPNSVLARPAVKQVGVDHRTDLTAVADDLADAVLLDEE